MKILLVNVDSRWNMAIRKMYAYYKAQNHDVEMLDLNFSGYPHNKTKEIDGSNYDLVCVSNIFRRNAYNVTITNCEEVVYGGIGSRKPYLQLPSEIENTEPFYYPDEDTDYIFITRGCIRNCWFCLVPKYEGKLREYNPDLSKMIKHKKVKFLDNNILAYEKHCEVFQYLIDNNIRCEFNQGLDFRLVNDENLKLLSQLNYMGEYIFAFDDPKYEKLLNKKVALIKKYIPKAWKLKFYIYFNAENMDVSLLIRRVEWCRKNECLPYIMRDENCWNAPNKDFLIDYAAYCNQPSFFKNMSFEDFLNKRHAKTKNINRINNSLNEYNNAIAKSQEENHNEK